MEIGYPVALKLQSPDLPHKAAAGVMALGIRDPGELSRTFAALLAQAAQQEVRPRIDGILIQEMVAHDAEYILGGLDDPIFGPVLTFGLGGVDVNQEQRIAFRPLPLQTGDVDELIEGTTQVRPEPSERYAALASTIEHFATLFWHWRGMFESLEINPLVLRQGTAQVVALDALAVVRGASSTAPRGAGRRGDVT
jgi:acetyltransferase